MMFAVKRFRSQILWNYNSPLTAAMWPLKMQMTVAGGGMTWQMDRVLSTDAHAMRDLSSLANFTVVTAKKITTLLSTALLDVPEMLF